MSNQNFINQIAAHAQRVHKEDGILASLIIAQGIHESNWGRSGLAQRGFNLFGIKGTYNGQSITMKTWEVYNGKNVMVDAAFRKYPSWYESIKDLAHLYKNGVSWNRNLYRAVINETDYKKAAQAVASAGYATDPNYAAKVIRTIEVHDLTQYDKGGSAAPAPEKVETGSGSSVDEYTVKAGDTLGVIAAQFGTTVDALVKLNNIKDKNVIITGQVLKIQGAAAETPKGSGKTYTVKAGDSLSKIAAAQKTTVDKLVQLNDISNPDLIRVGQVLKLDGEIKAPAAPARKHYTVKRGDTLSQIAAAHKISLAQIRKLNPEISDINLIHAGQKVRVQ